MNSYRDVNAQRRPELNPLTTQLALQMQSQTPASAVSFNYNPSTFTPSSAVRSYNPQQWTASPDGAQTRASPDIEVPAPPPYSPPRSQRPGGDEPSPAHRSYRPSPEIPATSFPPPPGGSRAGSRDRHPSRFSLSAFRKPDARSSPSPDISQAGPSRPRPAAIATTYQEPDAPPAARRAVSADFANLSAGRPRADSTTRWGPGMPLPPPPPGPPPPGLRSHSATRSIDLVSPPGRRAAPSTLGPVPPTPANWVEEDAAGRGRSPTRALQIDTSVGSSDATGLVRTKAVRGESKSIRERRSESRTGKSAVPLDEPSNNPWAEAITPSDIVVPLAGWSRRPAVKSTPRSGRTPQHLVTPDTGSRNSTPRPTPTPSQSLDTPTPPFSPESQKPPAHIPPKSLPTPPPQTRLHASPRPVSHILHLPNHDAMSSAPLSPARPPSTQSTPALPPGDPFMRAASERHADCIQREAAAATDEERVRIFADFIVAESRLRRERYAGAISKMGSEILELTRDLFRPYGRESQPAPKRDRASSMGGHYGSLVAALHETTRESNPPSAGPSPGHMRPESQWWSSYMPSLSPIPSMSVSEAPDEADSRGRPSSRWWEVSQSGSNNGDPSRLERRSKRESKYMGMPKELREALQYDSADRSTSSAPHSSCTAGPSTQTTNSADEYPPEKVGWHEPAPESASVSGAFSPAPFTPDPRHLDVSRLVTLPPPYPRHHPAVENNHPDLASVRTTVRGLSEFSEAKAIKQRFVEADARRQEEADTAASKRRDAMRVSIQREIEAGNMSYADAAKVEANAGVTEQEKEREVSKASFEAFQTDVVVPLNDTLMDRVQRATTLFEELRSQLFTESQHQSPNQTQEEGDEQPELLEKLTLLKWIFDAREQLHRELYDLLTDRNDRYRDMVILPYRQAGNQEKVQHATAFFTDDAAKRQLAFEQESLKRTEEFGEVVENNVVRGVEVQLSAFWDIAPGLRSIIEQVPASAQLRHFQIQIPAAEYDENPSYWQHPMQYLLSLLSHAAKSSYQFIESQTNLLCLLHEVKGVVTVANCRLMETQRVGQGEEGEVVLREMQEVRDHEETRLTDDLKEKVTTVEQQWMEGLGSEMGEVQSRIEAFLMETGGWEEEGV